MREILPWWGKFTLGETFLALDNRARMAGLANGCLTWSGVVGGGDLSSVGRGKGDGMIIGFIWGIDVSMVDP